MTEYQQFLKQVTKKFAEGPDAAIIKALDKEPEVVHGIPTGSFQLDRMLRVGGIPRGRLTQFFGPTKVGKSTLVYAVLREAQRQGLRCAYLDTEFAIEQEWLEAQGVDVAEDRLFFAKAEVGETVLDLAETLIRSEHFGLVVIDSIAGITARKELAAESVSDQIMGGRAGLIGRFLNRVKAPLDASGTALLCVNHLKEKVGVVYGDPRYRPGGKALDYYSSLILEVKKGEIIEQGKEPVGFTMRVAPFKTRFGSTSKHLEVELRVDNRGGLNREHDALLAGLDAGILTRRGAFVYWGEERLGQGTDAAIATLREGRIDALAAALRGE